VKDVTSYSPELTLVTRNARYDREFKGIVDLSHLQPGLDLG